MDDIKKRKLYSSPTDLQFQRSERRQESTTSNMTDSTCYRYSGGSKLPVKKHCNIIKKGQSNNIRDDRSDNNEWNCSMTCDNHQSMSNTTQFQCNAVGYTPSPKYRHLQQNRQVDTGSRQVLSPTITDCDRVIKDIYKITRGQQTPTSGNDKPMRTPDIQCSSTNVERQFYNMKLEEPVKRLENIYRKDPVVYKRNVSNIPRMEQVSHIQNRPLPVPTQVSLNTASTARVCYTTKTPIVSSSLVDTLGPSETCYEPKHSRPSTRIRREHRKSKIPVVQRSNTEHIYSTIRKANDKTVSENICTNMEHSGIQFHQRQPYEKSHKIQDDSHLPNFTYGSNVINSNSEARVPLIGETERSFRNSSMKETIFVNKTIRKGIMWVLQDKMFSRWKERYVILTTNYMEVFKKADSKTSDIGSLLHKVCLSSVNTVSLEDRRGYLTIVLESQDQDPGRLILRKTEGIKDWYNSVKQAHLNTQNLKVYNHKMKRTNEFWNRRQFSDLGSFVKPPEEWQHARNQAGHTTISSMGDNETRNSSCSTPTFYFLPYSTSVTMDTDSGLESLFTGNSETSSINCGHIRSMSPLLYSPPPPPSNVKHYGRTHNYPHT